MLSFVRSSVAVASTLVALWLAGSAGGTSAAVEAFSAGPAPAQSGATAPDRAPIVARGLHGNYIVPGTLGDIVYRRVGDAALSLDAYLQKEGESRPAVIVVHGGGWTSGSRIARVGQLLEMLTAAGFSWFSIDYRLAPEHPFPAPLDDLRAALEFVRDHAEELRIDPDRIAILGEDTGAQLALLLATERSPGLQAVVSLGGIFDLGALDPDDPLGRRVEAFLGLDPTSAMGQTRIAEASPLSNVARGMPPVMIVHGGADSSVPPSQARAYREALSQAGIESRLLEVPEAIHDVENWWPRQWHYKDEVVAWLSGTLGLPEAGFEPFRDERLTKDIAFSTFETTGGAEAELLMDAWIPSGEGPVAGVILAHGGGWEAGDKVTYLTPILEPLAQAGLAWFSIDYRLTPEYRHTDQLDDLRRAIRYVRHHAASFGVDPDRLAMLGESASGQMVAQLATEPCPGLADSADPVDRESCEVSAAVSFYGVYDFLPMVTDAAPRSLLVRLFDHHALDDEGRSLLRQYSPLYHVHRNMPPLLMINGTNEFLWDQAQEFSERLGAVGADHELVRLEGAGHGMESWEGRPEWAGYKPKLVDWLQRKLAPPPEPVVLNDDGGWCWFQDERAVVIGDRLVFGSVAAGRHDPARAGAVEATTVDLRTGTTTRVRLSEAAIPPEGEPDDHNAPAFVVRGDGRILAVYAGHHTENRFRHRVSVTPGDPGAWQEERSFTPSPSSRITYSNLHRLSGEAGRIYNFYRGLDDLFKPSVAWSDDDGETWTSGGVVIDVPSEVRHRPYLKYASDGRDTVHLAYTEAHPHDFDNSVYHVALRDGVLRRSDGQPIRAIDQGLRDPAEGSRVFRGDADNVAWVVDLELDGEGRPFVAYSVQRGSAGVPLGEGGEDHRYRLARWNGTRWADEEIAYAGTRLYAGQDDYTGGVALVPGDPDTLFVSTNAHPETGAPLVSTADGERHWEIFRGARISETGWRWTPLTWDSTSDNLRPVVPRADGRAPIVLWLRGAYRNYLDYDLEVVGLLPPPANPGSNP